MAETIRSMADSLHRLANAVEVLTDQIEAQLEVQLEDDNE